MLCRCTIEFLFVRDTFGVEWLGKSSRIAAVLDLAKRQHNTAKPGIASQHGHFHPFCPLYQWVKPARLFAPYKSCDHYGPKEVCQTLFRPWGQPWLQPLGSRLFEPGLWSKNRFFRVKNRFLQNWIFWVLNLLLSFLMSHNEPKESMCIPQNRQNWWHGYNATQDPRKIMQLCNAEVN